MSKSDLISHPHAGPRHHLSIVYRAITELQPRPRNPRTHSRAQTKEVAASIRRFGFTTPVIIDGNAVIIAGHCRWEAAKLLRFTEIPTISIAGLTPAQVRALALADNRLAEKAGWDRGLLRLEIVELLEFGSELEIEETGFSLGEIDILIEDGNQSSDTNKTDVQEEDTSGPAVTTMGDLWKCGEHYLICGDAREADSYRDVLRGSTAQMVFGDLPYNVPIDGHVSGKGSIKHREFAMAAGEMSPEQFIAFLQATFVQLIEHSDDGSIHYLCMDWRHIYELLAAGRSLYSALKNLCVWNKTNAGMGSFYRSKHELVAVFKKGTAKHINNFSLGESGRHRTNVWDYAGMTSISRERLNELSLHPTVKPVAMVADAIRDCSKRNGTILDPVLGSGSTLIAAELTGRRCCGIEIDPRYVDVSIRRWQRLTGEVAIRESDGQRFSDVGTP